MPSTIANYLLVFIAIASMYINVLSKALNPSQLIILDRILGQLTEAAHAASPALAGPIVPTAHEV
jgi:uncharacterized membrane protein required for colicin V production